MTAVVDCSIVIRVLANRDGDDVLRQRLARTLHAPALIEAEVSSVVRGLMITTKPNVRIRHDRVVPAMRPATKDSEVAEPVFLSAIRSGYRRDRQRLCGALPRRARRSAVGQGNAVGVRRDRASRWRRTGCRRRLRSGSCDRFLDSVGLSVSGVDLSPAMVKLAHSQFPDLRFDVGSMTALAIADATLAGIVAWYSIIHIPHDELPAAFGEFRRVLMPGGHLLHPFQVGNEPLHLTRPFGHPVTLEFHRFSSDVITGLLHGAGFRRDRSPDP